MSKPRPTYNHTRDDGPHSPCPECLFLMTREELIAFLRGREPTPKPVDPTTGGDAIGFLCGLARWDANGAEEDLIDKCEEYLRATLKESEGR
jgi:hypothetical protein